jgi:FtsH-binding integral membrane protein
VFGEGTVTSTLLSTSSVEEKAGTLIEGYSPLLPPPLAWAGVAIFYRFWPVWLLLTLLSLTVVIWHQGRRKSTSWGQWLIWVLAVTVLGPFGLLVYLLVYRKRRLAPGDALVTG